MGMLVKHPEFETQDTCLAAVLCTLGAPLIEIKRDNGNRCSFVFPNGSELQSSVSAYWHRELRLDPFAVLANHKAVKARLYGEAV